MSMLSFMHNDSFPMMIIALNAMYDMPAGICNTRKYNENYANSGITEIRATNLRAASESSSSPK